MLCLIEQWRGHCKQVHVTKQGPAAILWNWRKLKWKYCYAVGHVIAKVLFHTGSAKRELGVGGGNPHGYIYLLTQKPVTHVLLSKIWELLHLYVKGQKSLHQIFQVSKCLSMYKPKRIIRNVLIVLRSPVYTELYHMVAWQQATAPGWLRSSHLQKQSPTSSWPAAM